MEIQYKSAVCYPVANSKPTSLSLAKDNGIGQSTANFGAPGLAQELADRVGSGRRARNERLIGHGAKEDRSICGLGMVDLERFIQSTLVEQARLFLAGFAFTAKLRMLGALAGTSTRTAGLFTLPVARKSISRYKYGTL
jgi:hypothetical protein